MCYLLVLQGNFEEMLMYIIMFHLNNKSHEKLLLTMIGSN